MFFNDVRSDLSWQESAFVWPVVRVLLVVLLALGRRVAAPAKIVEAFWALDLGAPTLYFCDGNSAFGVWARFGAMFDVKFRQEIL